MQRRARAPPRRHRARRAPGGAPRCPAPGRAGSGRTRRRRRPSPAAVGGQGALRLAGAQVGTLGEERARLGDRRLARIGGSRRRGAMADRDGVDARRSASRCSRASAAQCASSPQPMRSSGKGSSVEKRARGQTRSPARSRRSRVSRTTLSGRRRVSGHAACELRRWAGWASSQREALARGTGSGRGSRAAARRRHRPAAASRGRRRDGRRAAG